MGSYDKGTSFEEDDTVRPKSYSVNIYSMYAYKLRYQATTTTTEQNYGAVFLGLIIVKAL